MIILWQKVQIHWIQNIFVTCTYDLCMYVCKVVDLQDLSFTEYFGIGMKFPCLMN